MIVYLWFVVTVMILEHSLSDSKILSIHSILPFLKLQAAIKRKTVLITVNFYKVLLHYIAR